MADRTDSTAAGLTLGGVYFATEASPLPTGQPAILVRVETRPGSDDPEALCVTARGRVVFDRWCSAERFADEWTEAYAPPADESPIGSAWKLEVAAVRRERDEAVEKLALALARPTGDPDVEAERDALAAVMKEAVKRMPDHRADLVALYRRLRGSSS